MATIILSNTDTENNINMTGNHIDYLPHKIISINSYYSNSGAGGVIGGVFGTLLCSFIDGLFVFSYMFSLVWNY